MTKFQFDEIVKLPATGSWPKSVHLFDDASRYAIQAALAAQRPLLLRGEPGTGKSQLARAAAQVLGRIFISEVVHSSSESQDLQYHFDAVGRLGEAQVLGATQGKGECDVREQLDPRNFLSPGALWWLFDWQSAQEQLELCRSNRLAPERPKGWQPADGAVLLIDEIDKADVDLPNGLLESLGNGAFKVPYLDQAIGLKTKMAAPLVIITTNEERELPAAFLRRCMVLNLQLPEKKEPFIKWLMRRGEIHFGEFCNAAVRKEAAEQLYGDRRDALDQALPAPGQAEYLDLLRAVSTMTETIATAEKEKEQLILLDKIKGFALKKQVGAVNFQQGNDGKSQ